MFLCCSSGPVTSCWHCLPPSQLLLQQQAGLRCLAAAASWSGRWRQTPVCLQQVWQVCWGGQLLQQQQQ
jgi:hypothetical protein